MGEWTKGPVSVVKRTEVRHEIVCDAGDAEMGTWHIADVQWPHHAALIAEAFNVANETGLTPRQLADENKELRETLQAINRCSSPGSRTLDDMMRAMGLVCDIARAALSRHKGHDNGKE